MHRHWTHFWIVVCLLGVCGCVTTTNNTAQEFTQCDAAVAGRAAVTAPENITISPVKVDIGELDAGGSTELVPEWSAQGKEIVGRCVKEHLKYYPGLNVIPMPELSREDKQKIDQHRALYEMIILNNNYLKTEPAWHHLARRVSTVGPGLSGLRQALGADAIVFVSGYDFHSTAGRKAAFVMLAVLTGSALPMGHCNLHTGLVDVQSGDILWSFDNMNPSLSLKNEQHVRQMLNQSFAGFPKIEKGDDRAKAE